MQEISVNALTPGSRFAHALYHSAGVLLLLPWHEVDRIFVSSLTAAGIQKVFICLNPAEVADLRKRSGPVEVLVDSLPADKPLDLDLCDASGKALATQGMALRSTDIDRLKKSGHASVYVPAAWVSTEMTAFRRACSDALIPMFKDPPADLLKVKSSGAALSQFWRTRTPGERNAEYIDGIYSRHAAWLQTTRSAYLRLRRNERLDLAKVHGLVGEMIELMTQDREMAAHLITLRRTDEYIIDHSLGVCLLSLLVGVQMGYGMGNLFDLGLAALLADVGMVRMPADILTKPGLLDPEERREIVRHPIYGAWIISEAVGADAHVVLAVLQTHERCNGQGYPNKRNMNDIHDYAHVIAVADTYMALISPRTYRPEREPHEAMTQVLNMVKGQSLHPRIAKALIQVLGLFPIGSLVRLTDGSLGRVVNAHADQVSMPMVSVVFGSDGAPVAGPRVLDLRASKLPQITAGVSAKDFGLDPARGFHSDPDGVRRSAQVRVAPADGGRVPIPPEVTNWSASFAGRIEEIKVLEVIQLLDLAQKSGVLNLTFENANGRITFESGDVMQAEYTTSDGRMDGEEAIYAMLSRNKGNFAFVQGRPTVERQITASNTQILMEACRRMDETQVIPEVEE
jgi:HD-GYP domain-containing protein (c-di-GMP phosphodiesterase class II)